MLKNLRQGSGIVLPGAHRVVAKGRVYWYASRGGDLLWRGAPEDEAAHAVAIASAYVAARDERPAPGTVARLLDDYERSADFAALSAQTQALYKPYLREAKARLGRVALKQFGERVGRDAIRKWRAEASTPRVADQIRTVLGAVASYGRREDVLPASCKPCADMRPAYRAPPQPAWTEAALQLAMTRLPPKLAAPIALAVNTGLRRGDLVALTWAAVDEGAGVIRWRTSKGARFGREAIIDLTPELRATLDRCDRSKLTVLTNTKGKPWTPDGLHNSLTAELDALGIKYRLHGLRRLAASRLSAQGLSNGQIARRLGWSEGEVARMLATYVDPEAERGFTLAQAQGA
jgi:integrase